MSLPAFRKRFFEQRLSDQPGSHGLAESPGAAPSEAARAWRKPSPLVSVTIAVLCVIAATAARAIFGQFGADLPFATFFPAVLAAGFFGGTLAAFVSGMLATVVAAKYFLPPHANVPEIALWLASVAVVVAFSHVYQRSLQRVQAQRAAAELMAKEVEHRRRNTYAMVEAIVRSSLKNDPVTAETIAARLHAVKRASDLTAHSPEATAFLSSLLHFELAGLGDDRWRFSGPDLALSPDVARHVILVLHELATNAVKHGALSKAEGQVEIESELDGRTATITWREKAGPVVAAPSRQGFGSILIDHSVRAIEGDFQPAYSPEGFQGRLRFALEKAA
jgi:two-component sensor histidine kinase